MKKFILFWIIFLINFNISNASYTLENGSRYMVEKYWFSQKNLEKQMTKKEFVETMYAWYKDYKKDRWVNVNYNKIAKLDNKKYFKDVDLNSEFWKKLLYFVWKKWFKENEYFWLNDKVSQDMFFKVMSRLEILPSLSQCVKLKICEKEANKDTPFAKWTYYKYISKILDKNLRVYYSNLWDYIDAWYKPFLSTNYEFPIKKQTLNWCYWFAVRNILKYKYWVGVYVPKVESDIWKDPNKLRYPALMDEYDSLAHVDRTFLYNLDSLIAYLQQWTPVAVTYILTYKDKTWADQKVRHIVSAYSFDKNWIWVSETVANKRLRVPYDQIFFKSWEVKISRMFSFKYEKKSTWDDMSKKVESTKNYLQNEL